MFFAHYSRSPKIRDRTRNSTFFYSVSLALIVWMTNRKQNAESIENSRILVSGIPRRIHPSHIGKTARELLSPSSGILLVGFITCMPIWLASTTGGRPEVSVRYLVGDDSTTLTSHNRHIRPPTPCGRSRRHGSSYCYIPHFSLNFSRHTTSQSSCLAISFLSEANWSRHEPFE